MPATRIIVLACLICALAPSVPALAVEVVPAGFVVDELMTWTGAPPWNGQLVSFAMLPDGRFLLTEKVTGYVDVLHPGLATPVVLDSIPDVEIELFEDGLLGIAVDPGWPTRPYVYFYYNHTGNVCYLVMYEMTGDLTDGGSTNLALTNPYVLLADIPDNHSSHNGGTLRFGPDGMLYLSIGDDAFGCNAQDLTNPNGSILRMDVSSMPGAGAGPPPKADITPAGNPFPGPGDWERLIWAYGLRNPFRFNIDPVTGTLVVGDVGGSAFEEVDVVAPANAGGNYGWPQLEGFIDPMCCGVCGPGPPYVDPAYVYPHTALPQAVICGPMYRGGGGPYAFGAAYEGNIFFMEFYEGWMRRLEFNGSTWQVAAPVPGQPTPENWAEGFDQMTDFQTGSDGALYVMRNTGTTRGIYRIRSAVPTGATAVAASPGDFSVRALPNPSPRASAVRFEIRAAPGTEELRLLVTDVAGRAVVSRRLDASASSWTWRAGEDIPAGVYFYRLQADGRSVADGKVTLVR